MDFDYLAKGLVPRGDNQASPCWTANGGTYLKLVAFWRNELLEDTVLVSQTVTPQG